MFGIIVTKAFADEFKKLENQLRERVKGKLEVAGQQPQLYFERLAGHELFKIRIGKYRVIAQINTVKKQITLLSIGHRKNVYNHI